MKIAICIGLQKRDMLIEQFASIAESHNVTIFTFYKDNLPKLPPHKIEDLSPLLKIKWYPFNDEMVNFMEGLEDKLTDFEIVISLFSLNLFTYQCAKAKEKHGFKLLVVEKDNAPFCYENYQNILSMKKEIYKHVDAVISFSESSLVSLIMEGVSKNDLKLIKPFGTPTYMPSSTSAIEFREHLKLAPDDFLICAFDDLISQPFCLDILSALLYIDRVISGKPNINLKVLYVGSACSDHLKRRAFDIGVGGRSMFLNDLPLEYYPHVIGAADCMVAGRIGPELNGEIDPEHVYPFNLLKFMKHEKPVITLKNSDCDEIISNSLTSVEQGNYEKLGIILNKLYKEIDFYKACGLKIVNRLSEHSEQKFSKELNKLVVGIDKKHDEKLYEDQFNQAKALISKREYKKAQTLLKDKLTQNDLPAMVCGNAYQLIGDCHNCLGQLDEAIESYGKCISCSPRSFEAYRGLASISLQMSQYEQALSFFQQALTYNDNDDKTFVGIGVALFHLQKIKEAQYWLKRALQTNPKNQTAVFTLLQISYSTNQIDLSEDTLLDYLRHCPNDIKMMIHLGRIYQQQDKIDDCSNVVRKILAIDPTNVQAQDMAQYCGMADVEYSDRMAV